MSEEILQERVEALEYELAVLEHRGMVRQAILMSARSLASGWDEHRSPQRPRHTADEARGTK